MRPLVVLFDLDGTALTFEGGSPGPGRTALGLAVREVFAAEDATHGMRFAGGTDRALVRAILARVGLAHHGDDGIDRVLAAYLRHLEAVLTTRRYRPVGDVAGAVAALRGQGAVVGVATGNVRAGARLKLASAGLAEVFDPALGGYGCDAEPRPDILRVAVARCAAIAGAAADVVVVGDTEHDVSAGRAVGAKVVGVAIYEGARAELEAAGADAIVDACGEPLVRAILGLLPGRGGA
ncbi:MAG TPA: HAD family hydrolase [Polyangiaceae bacterium]|nr:HAD family hydrolase [Polyangiaceae bacterium]